MRKCPTSVGVYLIMLAVFAGLAYAQNEKETVVGSVEELKSISSEKITWKKDRANMMLIPAGSFQMGSNKEDFDENFEKELLETDGITTDSFKPVHTVTLSAFYMDAYEVTVGQYKKFLAETGYREPELWHFPELTQQFELNQLNKPMVGVSWDDAVAYAKWAGKRLPTEAEWEYAARGGLTGRKYSWGDKPPSSANANYEEHLGRPARVGSYPPNEYGLYDIAGNVFEWCSDWYDENYYARSPAENPTGPAIGSFSPDYSLRVSRGGAWATTADYLRVGVRFATDFFESDFIFGFRCVVSAFDRGNLGYRPGPTELKVEILGEGEDRSVQISQHLDKNFNGVYKVRKGVINGHPWYQNDNNRYLYFYDQAEGGEKSWSLDHRQPNGSKDWFSGGWTRPVEGLTHPQPGVAPWTAIPDNLEWDEIQEAVGHMGYRPNHPMELPELELSVVIDSGQIKKRVISGYVGSVSKIQLTNFHSSAEQEISIIGSTIWFLSPIDYSQLVSPLPDDYFTDDNLDFGGFNHNTELLDVNNDGTFEIMQGGGGFGKVGLLDSNGNTLWVFQPDPELPPKRMVIGDLDNDSVYEFYVADYDGLYQLNDKGKIMWKINNQASNGSSIGDVEVLIDRKTNRHYLITVNDSLNYDGVFQIYDYMGKQIRQFPTPFPIMEFDIVEWNETVFILAGYLEDKAVLMDLSGKIIYQFKLENFPLYHLPQGIAVKFSPNENEYFVLLAHSRSSVGLTQLNIISPEGKIIYQEIINQTHGIISLDISDKSKEVLIVGGGGSGEILEYEMTTN